MEGENLPSLCSRGFYSNEDFSPFFCSLSAGWLLVSLSFLMPAHTVDTRSSYGTGERAKQASLRKTEQIVITGAAGKRRRGRGRRDFFSRQVGKGEASSSFFANDAERTEQCEKRRRREEMGKEDDFMTAVVQFGHSGIFLIS